MKHPCLAAFCSTLLLVSPALLPVMAQQSPSSPLVTPVTDDNLDPATFAQWVDGSEKPILDEKGTPSSPGTVLWTTTPHNLYDHSLIYGDSKTTGVRYLRIGFNNPVPIGSVLVEGGGQLSVLKPGAAYPGNLSDDSQWIPAQRMKKGLVSTDEVDGNQYALWVLPSVTSTRALRFAHVSQASDHIYGGTLNGAYVLSERLANLAPQAVATASSMPQKAGRLNDEWHHDGDDPWDNIVNRTADRPKTIVDDPEWVMLTWPSPVTISGLASLGTGYSAAEVQIYTGPADQHPSIATEDEWKTVKKVFGLTSFYPWRLQVHWIDLGSPVTTRAIRLRLIAALDEKNVHPHLIGNTNHGKRVWLDGLMALKPLDTAGLETAVLPVATDKSHAPIAIKFTLPEDGFVTLVVEDAAGKRVRNLIADTSFPKGENTLYWDGTDDLKRDLDVASHGLYLIPAAFVAPGAYQVRGLWHRQVDLNYKMSVYSPGNPPWPTQDTSGGWMTNHTPASSVVFIPADKAPGGQPLVGIGSPVSEGGSSLSLVDLNGNKLSGRGWIGGAWTGAFYLAHDNGSDAIPGVYAYVGSAIFINDTRKIEVRLTMLTPQGDKPVLQPVYLVDPGGIDPQAQVGGVINGLAVHNGLLIFSKAGYNQLVLISVKDGKVMGTLSVPSPRGLAFDSQGRLLVLSGKSLLRYTLGDTPPPAPEALATNLEGAAGLTVDGQGNIYVSDQGSTNQVKVFASDGREVKTYGKPGPFQAGPYDPDHMNNPKGIAVDSNGRLWVTEDCLQPKRVSVWNPDGTLWKAFYGPPLYGGGGALDPQDATRFSYDGMEFHLDWDKGTSTLQRIYYSTDAADLKLGFPSTPPEAALHFNGKRYMTDAFNSNATNGSNMVFIYLDKGDVVVPVAAAGDANDWDVLKGAAFKSLWPPGIDLNGNRWTNQAMFIWSDLNGDGQVQPNEVRIWATGINTGITVAQDGSFLFSNLDGHVARFKPLRFTPNGAPIYGEKEILGNGQQAASDGGGQALVGTQGWTVSTTAPPPFSSYGLGGAKDGVSMWSYPSLWPGLHASHNSPAPDHPGELIGTTRLLGDLVTPRDSDAGPLFFINSNEGDIYVFTQDGLFVTQLFQDVRQGPHWEMPSAQRGMLLNKLTLGDENFFPTVTQVPDGSIYVDSGDLSALVKVNGLESIHRLAPMSLSVSADDLKLAQDFEAQQEAARQAAQGTGVLGVALQAQAPALDANPDPWADDSWALIDQRGVAAWFDSHSMPYNVQGAVTVAGGNLFALWKTGDSQLLNNSGEIDNAPFKTGGALDLMIGADPNADPNRTQPVAGDLRLLVTQVKGKTKAVLYRQVAPGTPDAKKVPFSAPWHSITFDSVADVSDQVQLVADGKGDYEISVPLALLGLEPQDGMKIKGDIGILRGDGTQTTQRVYWNNKATAIVSDVPSEAMLTPNLWGIWEFRSKQAPQQALPPKQP